MAIRLRQHPCEATVLVQVAGSRFEVSFDATGQAVEIRRERWARYTSRKPYWARCWLAGRPIGARNCIVISLAREAARPPFIAAEAA
jgi:hypothetical protein